MSHAERITKPNIIGYILHTYIYPIKLLYTTKFKIIEFYYHFTFEIRWGKISGHLWNKYILIFKLR